MINKNKLGEWLEMNLDSHSIYDAEGIKMDMRELGYDGPFPRETTVGELRNHLGEFKGPQSIRGDYQEKTMNGWEIAVTAASYILGYDPSAHLNGRGSIFRACVEALKKG